MASSPQSNLCSRTIGLKPRFGTGKVREVELDQVGLDAPVLHRDRVGIVAEQRVELHLVGSGQHGIPLTYLCQRRIERQRGLVEDLILILLRQEVERLAAISISSGSGGLAAGKLEPQAIAAWRRIP